MKRFLFILLIVFTSENSFSQTDSTQQKKIEENFRFWGGNLMVGSVTSPLGWGGIQASAEWRYIGFNFGLGRYNGKKYELGFTLHPEPTKLFTPVFNFSWASTEEKDYKITDTLGIDYRYAVGRAQHLNYSIALYFMPKKWRKESSYGFFLRVGYRDRISNISIHPQEGSPFNQADLDMFYEDLFMDKIFWNFGIRIGAFN